MEPGERTCLVCRHPLPTRLQNHKQVKYCSRGCGAKAQANAYSQLNPRLNLPTGTTGALAELMVSTDLLRKGFEVFRALSPCCSCDLAVLKDSRVIRVEVRTGYRLKSGISVSRQGSYDIHATVLHDTGEIIYSPSLDALPGVADNI